MRRYLPLAIVLLTFTGPALPQERDAVAARRLQEAETIARLTGDGELLYGADQTKLRWQDYCANSGQLAEAGRFREAIRAASKALFLGVQSGNRNAQAYAKRDLAVAYSYAGNLIRAGDYARQAVRDGGGTREVTGPAYKVLGDVAMREGKPKDAIDEYRRAASSSIGQARFYAQVSLANAYVAAAQLDKAKETLDDIGSPSQSAQRHFVLRALANLAMAEKRHDLAAKHLTAALDAATQDETGYHRVWALEGLARARMATGDSKGALTAYLEATESAEKVRTRFRSEEFKAGLFGEMQSVFDGAVSVLASANEPERAFEVSERGRGRALLDMVRNRVSMGTGVAAFVDPSGSTASLGDLRAALGASQVAVQYHVLDDRTIAWTVRQSGIASFTVGVGRKDLARQVERFRGALAERSPRAQEASRALHALLVAPLELKTGEGVSFIAHDALHYLPFHALHDGTGYLVEKHAVSYAPTASTLRASLGRPLMSTAGQIVALGNPELGDSKLALPGAEREVERLKSVFPAATVFVRADATKNRFLRGAPGASLLHVAAHAEVDPIDPLHSRIRLSGDAKTSGDLEAQEVYGLNLSGSQMVVLSACDSGLGQVTKGDEVWGFTRAFLGAGAGSLVVTLWPVSDEATEHLMRHFYAEIAKGTGRREALRQAQMALIADEKLRTPFFWAGFTLVGDWR